LNPGRDCKSGAAARGLVMEVIPPIMFVAQLGNQLVYDDYALRVGTIRIAPNYGEKLLTKGVLVLVEIDVVPLENDA